MNELSAKERIQAQITHWIQTIQYLAKELDATDINTPAFQKLLSTQREFKGRIYAIRFLEHILGIEFDTDFNSID